MMEPILGEIRLLPFSYAPVGWLPCQGQVLNIVDDEILFSLLGTTYGGNGTATYALPDLRAHSPLGTAEGAVGYCICVNGVYPSRP
jgi:microcystin-dependent protein